MSWLCPSMPILSTEDSDDRHRVEAVDVAHSAGAQQLGLPKCDYLFGSWEHPCQPVSSEGPWQEQNHPLRAGIKARVCTSTRE